MVYQIFGAGELLPKMCAISFEQTHAHNIYSPAYGVVLFGGLMLMLARKPKPKKKKKSPS